eukprot:Colp12_sorted_trinity150504_noHs@6740
MDPCTYSNYTCAPIKHVRLNLQADFNAKVLKGTADLHVEFQSPTNELVFDTRDLSIFSARLIEPGSVTKAECVFGETTEAFGTPLRIHLPQQRLEGDKLVVRIEYQTAPQSTAIQWLEPELTAGKNHPYLFTQCQAIHARSLLPCQDTPSIKHSYTAEITCQAPLRALMSAVALSDEPKVTEDGHHSFSFEQNVPIPAYLIALVIGNLESREIGPRTKVWSEASMVDAGAFEFSETETFISTAESFLIPYAWGRYDILLLPPSFPYGGMENPCLTFVTPTLLAGDRSLANVVAHEIAHSWSGNLVTNATWEDFWLNEGFTVFIERRILEKMTDHAQAELDGSVGWSDLLESVNRYGHEHNFTCLKPSLKDQDPDDAFSTVPYEKGYNFLRYLERLVGGQAAFEKWLALYFDTFKYKSITTDDMRSHFTAYFAEVPAVKTIDWDTWLFTPGMPKVDPQFDRTLIDGSEKLAHEWMSKGVDSSVSANDLHGWSSKQLIVFLEALIHKGIPMNHDVLRKLDETYKLSSSRNAEIRFRWQTLCLRSNYTVVFPQVVEFLKEQGRMKFVRPLFRDLANATAGKPLAITTFKEHSENYHSIARKMIGKDLGLF